MAGKVYAVKRGFDSKSNVEVKNKIVNTWDECLKYVRGVKGAQYKSFKTLEEAKEYLSDENAMLKKGEDSYPLNIPHAYVDGSYNIRNGKYSYGIVVVENDIVIYIENGSGDSDEQQSIRQIAGELKGAINSVEYAVEKGIKHLVIFHDYVGVCYHATGAWERKDKSSQEYYEKINKLMKDNDIKITFVKVDSHTGDLYNEMVDEFAKSVIGVTLQGEVNKYLKDNGIYVKDLSLKEKMKEIIKEELLSKIYVKDNEGNTCNHLESEDINKESKGENEKDNDNKSEKMIIINREIKKMIKFAKEDEGKFREYIRNLDESIKDSILHLLIKKLSKV